MKKSLILPAALPVFLAACGGGIDTASPQAPSAPVAACGADSYAGLVGQNIAAVTLPGDLWFRVIYPDTAVTLEFVAERLNFDVDNAGVIQAVRCG